MTKSRPISNARRSSRSSVHRIVKSQPSSGITKRSTRQSTPAKETVTRNSGLLSPPPTPPKQFTPKLETVKRADSSSTTKLPKQQSSTTPDLRFTSESIDLSKDRPGVVNAAYELAAHAGRQTILQEDIDIARMFAGRISVNPTRRDELEFLSK